MTVPPLDDEQLEAVNTFAEDFRAAVPVMMHAGQTAQRIWHEIVRSPTLSIPEKPDDVSADMWSVGHAKINYTEKD